MEVDVVTFETAACKCEALLDARFCSQMIQTVYTLN